MEQHTASKQDAEVSGSLIGQIDFDDLIAEIRC